MTATTVLNVLMGAMLVAIGVLAAALADRVRGLRPQRAAVSSTRAPRASIEVVDLAPKQPRASRESKPKAQSAEPKARAMADEVIAALVAANYKKSVAAEAVQACDAAERATIESWLAAALRRCARGGLS